MNIRTFLFDSAYQLITWVCIALSVGGIYHFASKSNLRGALWSLVFLMVSIVVMLGLLPDRYIVEAKARRTNKETRQDRPYVVFRAMLLSKPLAVGSYPAIDFELENISTTNEVTVEFTDITYYFTPDLDMKSLQYQKWDRMRLVMPPTQKYVGKMRFEKFIIDEEQLKAFNENRMRLFFFGRGKYTDESGQAYPLPFCRMYDPDIAGNLILCDDTITFK